MRISMHNCISHSSCHNEKTKKLKTTIQSISYHQTNEVSWIVDPARSVRLFSKPMRANYRDYQFGSLNHLLYVLAEIRSRWNGIKIHEDVLLPELRLQPVINPTSYGQRIFSPVGNGDHESAPA